MAWRRSNQETDAVLATSKAWQQTKPATIAERRGMKKIAQPEHAYTGYIPQWLEPETDERTKKHPPILGYKGHLRHHDDMIGTTFSKSLEVAGVHNETGKIDQRVRFGEPTQTPRTNDRLLQQMKPNDFTQEAVRPPSSVAYGAFDGASAYGEFMAKPSAGGSGYGAFDGASGYGEFMARSQTGGSGYGAFDCASGYGEFMARPGTGGSGYGAFDGASGYGQFMARPGTSGSGYGAFDGASGYGEFAERPEHDDFVHHPTKPSFDVKAVLAVQSSPLDLIYKQALAAVGGEKNALKILDAAAQTISQRYVKRTELLQALRRSFERRERENGGEMTKAHIKEAFQGLACVFTDDQITALIAVLDRSRRGIVLMDTMLQEISRRL